MLCSPCPQKNGDVAINLCHVSFGGLPHLGLPGEEQAQKSKVWTLQVGKQADMTEHPSHFLLNHNIPFHPPSSRLPAIRAIMQGGFIEERAMITTRIQPLNKFRKVQPPPPPSKPLSRKKVSFEADATTIPHTSERSDEEIKTRWYSKRELALGCREAKQTVALINSVNGDWNAIDHSQICIVGLEKFHGKKERDANKKLLIKSVLIRQEMNKNLGLMQETSGLKEISSMISASFKEYARWQAAMHMVHAYGRQPSSYAPLPPLTPPQPSMNCNGKRLRIDITQTKTHPAVTVNNTPKMIQTLEGCTNTRKRINRR